VGDEHPAYAPAGAWFPLPLPLRNIKIRNRQTCQNKLTP